MFTACRSPLQARFAARIISNSRIASFSQASSGASGGGETASVDPITTTTGSSSDPMSPSPPPTSTMTDTRRRALSLYRQLLRGAERMPTPNRQNYIKRKTRSEFRRHMTLTDMEEIDFQLRLADTNLDTVLVQAEHLSRLFSDPEYQNYN